MTIETFEKAQGIVREINKKELQIRTIDRIITSSVATADPVDITVAYGDDEVLLDPRYLPVTTILMPYCEEVKKGITALKNSLEEL